MQVSLNQRDAREVARASTTVFCEGWLVCTVVTDGDGREDVQHGHIYRTHAEAAQIARKVRKLASWERSITRTVVRVRTAFLLSDVLAGKATRWLDDERAELAA